MPRESSYHMIYRPNEYKFFNLSDSHLMNARPGFTPRSLKIRSHAANVHPTLHPYMDRLLEDGELKGYTVDNQPAEPLIKTVFPDEALPKPVSIMFLFLKSNTTSKSFQYSPSTCGWRFFNFDPPPKGQQQAPDIINGTTPSCYEDRFAKFANDLGDAMASFPDLGTDFGSRNLFTGKFSVKPVKHTGKKINRKPDVIGAQMYLLFHILKKMAKDKNVTISWPNIRIVIELKVNADDSVFLDIANKVWAIFDQQPERRYVPSLILLGHDAYFSVWNRAGVVHSEAFNIDEHPELFLRVMMGLIFGSDTALGLDPTMYLKQIDENKSVWRIRTQKGEFEYVETLWTSGMIQGRATWCWVVRKCDTGELLVMKDSWVLAERWPDEAYFFKRANEAQVSHIPTMWHNEDVEIYPGKYDSTDLHRGKYKTLDNRRHRRLFFLERGVPLNRFRSKREYLQAFIDTLTAHGELEDKAGILHRDISNNNILITLEGRGLLIDLDYAFDKNMNEALMKGPRGVRTGTPPFIAADLLFNENTPHKSEYDIESFFYVFVFGCAVCPKPGEEELSDKKKPRFILEWLYPISGFNLAVLKRGQLGLEIDTWRFGISSMLPPYWNFLKNAIWRLKGLLHAKKLSRKEFLSILNETLTYLPLNDKSTIGDDLTLPADAAKMTNSQPEESSGDEGYETPTPAPRSGLKRGFPDESSIVNVHADEPRRKRAKMFRSLDAELLLSQPNADSEDS